MMNWLAARYNVFLTTHTQHWSSLLLLPMMFFCLELNGCPEPAGGYSAILMGDTFNIRIHTDMSPISS